MRNAKTRAVLVKVEAVEILNKGFVDSSKVQVFPGHPLASEVQRNVPLQNHTSLERH